MHLAAGDKIAGSIQLRVRWVHSLKAFLHTRIHDLEVGGHAYGTGRLLVQRREPNGWNEKTNDHVSFRWNQDLFPLPGSEKSVGDCF